MRNEIIARRRYCVEGFISHFVKIALLLMMLLKHRLITTSANTAMSGLELFHWICGNSLRNPWVKQFQDLADWVVGLVLGMPDPKWVAWQSSPVARLLIGSHDCPVSSRSLRTSRPRSPAAISFAQGDDLQSASPCSQQLVPTAPWCQSMRCPIAGRASPLVL